MVKRSKAKQAPYKKIKSVALDRYRSVAARLSIHPVLVSAVFFLLYLFVFQRHFLFSGDVWAETHMEYLQNALKGKASDIFALGWAGYLAVIPALLVKSYVALGGPIGYIDYYYQVIIVGFAIAVSAFTVSRMNRELFGTFFYRLLFGLSILMLLHEKSTFTVINIWYVGFVPIILICISNTRLRISKQMLYTIWGVLLAITKPSLLLLPFVLYRAYRTREYVSNGLIAAAVILQTYLMLFKDPRGTGMKASHDILFTLKAVFTGCAVEFLKLFRIIPTNLLCIFVANLIIVGLFIIAIKRLGFVRSGLLAFGLLFSVYSYVMAPDSLVFTSIRKYQEVYFYNFKIQREYMVYVFLLLLIFIALPYLLLQTKKLKINRYTRYITPVLAGLIVIRIFMPIDVQSAGVAANIDQFRSAMSSGESVCVPIPPTTAYFPHALWQFSSNIDICHARNFDLNPDLGNIRTPIGSDYSLIIPNDTPFPLKTVDLVVRNASPHSPQDIALTDTLTGVTYYGHIPARDSETINYVPINVAGQPYREFYQFRLTAPKNLYIGRFKEDPKPIYYPFFGESNAPYHRTRR